MMIPIGVTFTASRRGKILCDVTCDHCSCQYVYLLRKTIASASTASPVTPTGSALKARMDAERRLERELLEGNNPAPCPECGYIQPDMVKRIKSKRSAVPVALLFVSVLVGLVCLEMSNAASGIWSPQILIPASGFLFTLPWLAFVWSMDLNSAASERLKQELTDRYGAVTRETFDKNPDSVWGPAVLSDGGGRSLRIDCDRLRVPPDICCACSEKSDSLTGLRDMLTKIGQRPGMPSQSRIPVPWNFPICESCVERAKSRRRTWIATRAIGSLILAAICFGVGFLLSPPETMHKPGDMNAQSFVVLCFIMAGLVCIALGPIGAWALSSQFAVPVRFKWLSTNTGVGYLQFESASYPPILQKFNLQIPPPQVGRRPL